MEEEGAWAVMGKSTDIPTLGARSFCCPLPPAFNVFCVRLPYYNGCEKIGCIEKCMQYKLEPHITDPVIQITSFESGGAPTAKAPSFKSQSKSQSIQITIQKVYYMTCKNSSYRNTFFITNILSVILITITSLEMSDIFQLL